MIRPLSECFTCDRTFLNTATVGLACDETVSAMQSDLKDWSRGALQPAKYDETVYRCRELFASFVGGHSDEVSIANQASTTVGLLAASLPKGSRVLAAEGDFTSLLFPFMAQQSRGVELTLVPHDEFIDSITDEFDWVCCSVAQSSNGKVIDLDRLASVAKISGCKILLDGTQAVGWMPIQRQHWDVLVCGAYKWLLSPRGTAFSVIKPELFDAITPLYANWYAGEKPWDSIYGGPLRLAASARRFDISPAWLNWVGTLPALELLGSIGIENIYAHNLSLAHQFCERSGLPRSNSAIVSVDVKEGVDLDEAGISASIRAGSLRLSFHLYNSEEDVNRVCRAIL